MASMMKLNLAVLIHKDEMWRNTVKIDLRLSRWQWSHDEPELRCRIVLYHWLTFCVLLYINLIRGYSCSCHAE